MSTPFWDPAANIQSEQVYGGAGPVPEAIGRDQWSQWDRMTLAGIDVPGWVHVAGNHTRRTDERKVAGVNSATLTNLGYDPAEVDITVTMWTPRQWSDFESKLLPIIKPRVQPATIAATLLTSNTLIISPASGGSQQVTVTVSVRPVDVYYPSLAAYGIRSLYIRAIGLPIPGPVFGSRIVLIRATEFAPGSSASTLPMTGSYQSRLDSLPSAPQAGASTPPPSADPLSMGP